MDAAGNPVLDASGQPQVETCPSGAVEPPGDLLDGVPDGLIDGRPIADPRPPRISQPEWAWGGTAMLGLTDPAPDDRVPSDVRLHARGRRRGRGRCRSSTR